PDPQSKTNLQKESKHRSAEPDRRISWNHHTGTEAVAERKRVRNDGGAAVRG
ncbi:hypothetical protein A2U01_0085269, partial [Trifolium medium]|nr:hypothetical protein [Trifolium medium]